MVLQVHIALCGLRSLKELTQPVISWSGGYKMVSLTSGVLDDRMTWRLGSAGTVTWNTYMWLYTRMVASQLEVQCTQKQCSQSQGEWQLPASRSLVLETGTVSLLSYSTGQGIAHPDSMGWHVNFTSAWEECQRIFSLHSLPWSWSYECVDTRYCVNMVLVKWIICCLLRDLF